MAPGFELNGTFDGSKKNSEKCHIQLTFGRKSGTALHHSFADSAGYIDGTKVKLVCYKEVRVIHWPIHLPSYLARQPPE